jgi:hypothetical protein
MMIDEGEIERIAREMIKQHGGTAARAAVERLNDRIDRGDWHGRDVWARIVHAIHDFARNEAAMAMVAAQRTAPEMPTRH